MQASYETAGSLRGGSRVWILAKLRRDPMTIVKGDDVEKYLMLSNSHDGTLAVRVGYTPVRVVCANTLAMAHEDSTLLRIRHTKGVAETLDVVRDAVNLADRSFEMTAEKFRHLAARGVSADDLESFVKVVFDTRVTAAERARRASKASKKAVAEMPAGVLGLAPAGGFAANDSEEKASRILPEITRLFEGGRGNTLPGVRGTWWALYNATTEYLQYEKRGTAETRLDSLAFGDGATKSRKALEAALRMAA